MYIYYIFDTINNKGYVGQKDSNPSDSTSYYGSGVEILKAIEKYGIENFTKTILYETDDRDMLNKMETYYIEELNTLYPNGYNKWLGPVGSQHLVRGTKEYDKWCNNISSSLIGNKVIRTKEQTNKLSNTMKENNPMRTEIIISIDGQKINFNSKKEAYQYIIKTLDIDLTYNSFKGWKHDYIPKRYSKFNIKIHKTITKAGTIENGRKPIQYRRKYNK